MIKRYKIDPCDYNPTKSTMCEKIIEDVNGEFVLFKDIEYLISNNNDNSRCSICGKKTPHRKNGKPGY